MRTKLNFGDLKKTVKVVQLNLECKRLIDRRHWNELEIGRKSERKSQERRNKDDVM